MQIQWDYNEVRFVHAELEFYSASSVKQQSADRHVAPLGHIILIPSQPGLALFIPPLVFHIDEISDINLNIFLLKV
jgi:hypothetical protein